MKRALLFCLLMGFLAATASAREWFVWLPGTPISHAGAIENLHAGTQTISLWPLPAVARHSK